MIRAPQPTTNFLFGTAVAVDPQTLVVGDYHAFATGPAGQPAGTGQVHVYTRTGTIEEWQELPLLLPDGPRMSSEVHFGENLALSGNVLVVSAHRDRGATDAEQGGFYAYTRSGVGQPFVRAGKFGAVVPVNRNRFGEAVATNSNFIAAAASREGSGTQVQVYRVSGGTVTFAYAVEIGAKVLGIAINQAGVMMLTYAGPGVRAFHLQQNSATPLDTSLVTGNFETVRASGNSFAVLSTTLGAPRFVVATVDTARVTAVKAVSLTDPPSFRTSLSYVENQHVLVPGTRAVSIYQLQAGEWVSSRNPPSARQSPFRCGELRAGPRVYVGVRGDR